MLPQNFDFQVCKTFARKNHAELCIHQFVRCVRKYAAHVAQEEKIFEQIKKQHKRY